MNKIDEKFAKLGIENAPGQEGRQKTVALDIRGEKLEGRAIDFSHGDLDAFPPIPGALDAFIEGVNSGGEQAYTEYRGRLDIRQDLAIKLADFTHAPVSANEGLILTPGTQGALFLAMGATVSLGDKVAIVEPDYFANRKLVEFYGGQIVPIKMDYLNHDDRAGLDMNLLEQAFKNGVKAFLFSNPNNPTGVIYSNSEIITIAELAEKYGVTVIVDQLYSRQLFEGREYTHLRAQNKMNPENLITIFGPSKTESLSGFRIGAAFGSEKLILRMEKLQAIMCLRAAGYSQAVFRRWFSEPEGWLEKRILDHQKIRDDLLAIIRKVDGMGARTTEAGSYLFPYMPELDVSITDFVKILRLHANVSVTPGTQFGPQFINSFRINFSQDYDMATDAIRRVTKMVERYRKNG